MALSALRASGLDAVLLDNDPLTGAWREPYGSGGYRLAATPADAPAARALIEDAAATSAPRRATPGLVPPTPRDPLTTLRLVMVALLFIAIAFVFLWRGLR